MSDSNDQALLRAIGEYARRERNSQSDVQLSEPTPEQVTALERRVLELLGTDSTTVAARSHVGTRRHVPRWLLWSLPLSVAAALVLFEQRSAQLQALPAYKLEIAATAAETREAPAVPSAALHVRAGALTTLIARPDTRIQGEVSARVFARHVRHVEPLAAELTADPTGAVRLRVALSRALAGRAQLVVIVGRIEDLQAAKKLANGPPTQSAGYQSWVLPIIE